VLLLLLLGALDQLVQVRVVARRHVRALKVLDIAAQVEFESNIREQFIIL
jgi:hypothetical protein